MNGRNNLYFFIHLVLAENMNDEFYSRALSELVINLMDGIEEAQQKAAVEFITPESLLDFVVNVIECAQSNKPFVEESDYHFHMVADVSEFTPDDIIGWVQTFPPMVADGLKFLPYHVFFDCTKVIFTHDIELAGVDENQFARLTIPRVLKAREERTYH